ncbi:MAG: hypothetical protein H6721_21090 [Sandaracinus sp.]|nr:hypothetical protein [Sandaracinus sp.]MCB9634629.1 hypothetical protein [Sandaracinus sp.]
MVRDTVTNPRERPLAARLRTRNDFTVKVAVGVVSWVAILFSAGCGGEGSTSSPEAHPTLAERIEPVPILRPKVESTGTERTSESGGSVDPERRLVSPSDELVELACASGPVPDDLEILFGEDHSAEDVDGSHSQDGLYAGNRVVRIIRERGEIVGRPDPALGRPSDAWFRLEVRGSLSELARRKLWCSTVRELATIQVPARCEATDAPTVSAVRIRTGGREWRWRVLADAGCPWGRVSGPAVRFSRYVLSRPRIPIALAELQARVASVCELPRVEVRADISIGEEGRVRSFSIERGVVSEQVAGCIARIASEMDASLMVDEIVRNSFALNHFEMVAFWGGGRALGPGDEPGCTM